MDLLLEQIEAEEKLVLMEAQLSNLQYQEKSHHWTDTDGRAHGPGNKHDDWWGEHELNLQRVTEASHASLRA